VSPSWPEVFHVFQHKSGRLVVIEAVEPRDVGHGHGMDVAVRCFTEIGGVGLLAELVPVAGEGSLRARALEGDAEPADPGEEIDEGERL